MNIIKQFLTPNKYSRPQLKLKKVTGVAWHYVGNPNTSAQANRNYFENLKNTHAAYVSSHYIIGLNGEIIQCIPETEQSYCTVQANSYTISIECCHPDSTGKFNVATERALIELTADICKRYGLQPEQAIMRHYDVTGKKCPLYYVNYTAAYTAAKERVAEIMRGQKADWVEQNGRWWYQHTDGGYTRDGWEKIDGQWYYFDNDGWMKTGWQSINHKWYYLKPNGSMATGWLLYKENWYYLDTDGVMMIGWQEIDGRWYYLNPSSGEALRGTHSIDGKSYHFAYRAENGLKECQWVER